MMRFSRSIRAAALVAVMLVTVLPAHSQSVDKSTMVRYALCDIELLYIVDSARAIDWPILYYLSDVYGVEIQIVTLERRTAVGSQRRQLPERDFVLTRFYVPDSDSTQFDSITTHLFSSRWPDIVIVDNYSDDALMASFADHVLSRQQPGDNYFGIVKAFNRAHKKRIETDIDGMVIINTRELFGIYEERIRDGVRRLGVEFEVDILDRATFSRYRQFRGMHDTSQPTVSIVQDLPLLRLTSILEEVLPDGPKKATLVKLAEDFVSSFQKAKRTSGREQAESVLRGYRAYLDLYDAISGDPAVASHRDLKAYFDELADEAQRAATKAAGLNWEGKIINRESAHGPKLKYRATLSVEGPSEIRLNSILFGRLEDTTMTVIDSVPKTVLPHQTFVREYLVDLDDVTSARHAIDPLVFTAKLQYGQIPLKMRSAVPTWEPPELKIVFEPDFYFVPPLSGLNVDRIVTSTTIHAAIRKPLSYAGTVNLNLETPRGLFAGAYRKELELENNTTYITVRIPFSISELFEPGVQRLVLSLSTGGQLIAADTALVRTVSCRVADTVKVGFLPDTSGLLEDILGMTDAAFRPLTDRGLLTADLAAYNVLIIGSGSFRQYVSFRKIKDRFADYVRQGGSIVIMGQPDDWPQGVLPLSLYPAFEMIDKSRVVNPHPEARVLNQPYVVLVKDLLTSFERARGVSSALAAPAEKILETKNGGALLSVSRFSQGHVVYCGLPLLELVSDLNLEAIHLFANLLNY